MRSADVTAAFEKWKADLVTSDGAGRFMRVRRPDSPGAIDTSNSEGMGYGMLGVGAAGKYATTRLRFVARAR